MKIILGIETSCDDTSICLLKGEAGVYKTSPHVEVFEKFSQEKILAKWGGVVPEIAARNHLHKLVPLLKETLKKSDTNISEIDAIAITTYPGLLGPLLTGLNAAKTLSLLFETPIIPVNHIYAHLEAIHLSNPIEYPYLGVVISGGHSMYMLVNSPTEMKVLGSTIDDAAGEAFDKGGKLLGLGYPAGQIIDQRAAKAKEKITDVFPIGLKSSADSKLSFSGVKTSLRTYIEKNKIDDDNQLNEVCYSYQDAIVKALNLKLKYALKEAREITGLKGLPIVVGGGVACNSHLRDILKKNYKNVSFVEPKYCTDNGAMIANLGLRTFDKSISFPESLELDARGNFFEGQNS